MFHTFQVTNPPVIRFQNVTLKYMDAVKHLGHILYYKLDDGPDIVRAIKDLNKKANSMLYTFRSADPVVKTFLIKTSKKKILWITKRRAYRDGIKKKGDKIGMKYEA